MNQNVFQKAADVTRAEQSVIGALLVDNNALDRIAELSPSHFYSQEHQRIYAEICRQVVAGHTVDAISLYEALNETVQDCMPYLHACYESVATSANIERHAQIIMDRAMKRSIGAIGREMVELQDSMEPADAIADRMMARMEEAAQKKTSDEPRRLSEMLGNYVELIQARMEGKIKPIKTGFADLDKRLGGGLDRGTLSIIAARPSMGKTAMALCLARNVAEWGSSLFLSMEMSESQVNDRNIAALGKLPLSWLKDPDDRNSENWDRMTSAFARANELNLFIDDKTGLNMLQIRAKARAIKRKRGLDMLVIDQLSFITGGDQKKQGWEVVGEYTRSMLALAKELNIAVVLLCQLNRNLEQRGDKRPQMSDLALSGSIEQDAANIIFLYRDEIYNPNSRDKGICEVITTKQRQGEPGVVGLAYIGAQTRFEDLATPWQQGQQIEKPRSRGFE